MRFLMGILNFFVMVGRFVLFIRSVVWIVPSLIISAIVLMPLSLIFENINTTVGVGVWIILAVILFCCSVAYSVYDVDAFFVKSLLNFL